MEIKDIITVISIIISIVAVYLSYNANKKHDKLTREINSADYQLKNNQKKEILELISVVRFINAKAIIAEENIKSKNKEEYVLDYTNEINRLSQLLESPSFVLFLKSFDDSQHKYYMESFIHRLLLKISSEIREEDYDKISSWSTLILQQIDFYKNFHIDDLEIPKIIGDLCKVDGLLTHVNSKQD